MNFWDGFKTGWEYFWFPPTEDNPGIIYGFVSGWLSLVVIAEGGIAIVKYVWGLI